MGDWHPYGNPNAEGEPGHKSAARAKALRAPDAAVSMPQVVTRERERDQVRATVVRASELAKMPHAKDWLRYDKDNFWGKKAKAYLAEGHSLEVVADGLAGLADAARPPSGRRKR